MTDARDPLVEAMGSEAVWNAVMHWLRVPPGEKARAYRAITTALRAELPRHGLAVVPVEPTPHVANRGAIAILEMREAQRHMPSHQGAADQARACHRAMIAAAQEDRT